MLATLGGCLALLLGVAVLLLPLLTPELSRPRDTFWGAVVLLLGLVLVTSSERLTGAPMLAVLCGGLLIGRLGGEVGRGRWNQLSLEERSALATPQRWASGVEQLAASAARLLGIALEWLAGLAGWLAARRQPKTSGKRWVRPEADVSADPVSTPEVSTAQVSTSEAPAREPLAHETPVDEAAAAAAPRQEGVREAGASNELPAGQAPGQEAMAGGEAAKEDGASESAPSPAAAESAARADPSPDPADPGPVPLLPGPMQASAAELAEAEAPPMPPVQDGPESLPEEVEVEILDPPPPQRTVPDFHAIDALLRTSGALPPTDQAEPAGADAEPPLAEVELEPEAGAHNAAASGAPRC